MNKINLKYNQPAGGLNSKIFNIFSLLFFSFPFVLYSQSSEIPTEILTLDEIVNLAVKNDTAILSMEQDIIIAKQRVREARLLSFPQVSLSATISRLDLEYPMVLPQELGARYMDAGTLKDFYTFRAYALQPIYTGGRNKSTLKMAKTSLNQAKVNYETVQRDIIFNAKKSFYSLLYYKESLEITMKWHKKAQELYDGIKKNEWEQIEAKILLDNLESEKEKAKENLKFSRLNLLKALNRETDSMVDISGELETAPVSVDLRKSIVMAMEMRSELKSEMYKAQMDDIAVNMAMIRRYPNIYLGASYDIVGDSFKDFTDSSLRSNNWMASVAIHFPLSLDLWTQITQKKAQQRQGDLKRSSLQDTIRFEIFQNVESLSFWQNEAIKRKNFLSDITRHYESALKKSSMSMSSLRMLFFVFDANKKYLDSLYEQVMAKIKLEWAQGKDFPQSQ